MCGTFRDSLDYIRPADSWYCRTAAADAVARLAGDAAGRAGLAPVAGPLARMLLQTLRLPHRPEVGVAVHPSKPDRNEGSTSVCFEFSDSGRPQGFRGRFCCPHVLVLTICSSAAVTVQ